MAKKVLSVILSVIMILSFIPFTLASAEGEFEGYTAITDMAGLNAIINDMSGKYYLANDIAVSGNWNAIGWTDSDDVQFAGTFDGNGYKINGIGLDADGCTNLGLFAIVGAAATVKNVEVVTNGFGGSANIGGIAGINYGLIEGCKVSGGEIGAYQDYLSSGSYGNAGGIAGTNRGTIKSCETALTNVFGYYYVGGIAGSNFGTIAQCTSASGINTDYTGNNGDRGYAGGLAGRTNGTIADCVVKDSNIRGTTYFGAIAGKQYAGGIIERIIVTNNTLSYNKAVADSYSLGVGSVVDATLIKDTVVTTQSGNMPMESTGITTPIIKENLGEYIKSNESFTDEIWTLRDGQPAVSSTAPECLHANIKVTAAKAATCTEDGCTEGKVCTDCGEVLVESTVIPATGHNFSAEFTVDVEPTCTEAGSQSKHCADCDAVSEVTEIAPLGHDYVRDADRDIAATCTTDGLEAYTCSRCGAYNDVVVEALGHDYVATVTAPTCTEKGYTTYVCSACGDTYTDSEVAENGHSYEAVVTPATCTVDGYTTHTCAVCGDTYTDSVVEAFGHDMVETNRIEPTYETEGFIDFKCTRCDRTSRVIIPMLKEADLTAAKDAIARAYEILPDEAYYTAPTITAMKEALVALEAAIAGKVNDSRQGEIDNLTNTLTFAITVLKIAADTTGVEAKIAEYEAFVRDCFDMDDGQRNHIKAEIQKIKDAIGYNEDTHKATAPLSEEDMVAVDAMVAALDSYCDDIKANTVAAKTDNFFQWLINFFTKLFSMISSLLGR